jgi:1-acyl-sn-glycerol-3-phosphate acyltransferase
LYWIIKILIRGLLYLFFSKRIKQASESYNSKGPILLVANHPNSFLDAIIIGASFNKPVHFLARGDAFIKRHHRFFLEGLNMIPIYRMREGRSKLYLNASSFVKTQAVLNSNGIVLIFIEGICLLTHELQPFQKGAARIVMDYKGEAPLHILPVCVRYEQIPAVYKKVAIVAGNLFEASSFLKEKDALTAVRNFNEKMYGEITRLLSYTSLIITSDTSKPGPVVKILKILIWPIYWPLSKFVYLITNKTVFFDSVLFGAMLIAIPAWIFILIRMVIYITFNT